MPCLTIFFFNDTATTEIYTLSLHDALPISPRTDILLCPQVETESDLSDFGNKVARTDERKSFGEEDRKSTRLNSSHQIISYAVFCFKKKKTHSTKTALPHTQCYHPQSLHFH